MWGHIKRFLWAIAPNAAWDAVKVIGSFVLCALITVVVLAVRFIQGTAPGWGFVGIVFLISVLALFGLGLIKTREIKGKKIPHIVCFEALPTAVWVMDNGEMTEIGTRPRKAGAVFGILARFENEYSENGAEVESVTARIVFEDEDGNKARVEKGCWVEEDYNSVEFDMGETHSLVLCAAQGEGKYWRLGIPDDRRESLQQYQVVSRELTPGEYNVGVILNYGPKVKPSEYRFKVDLRNPPDLKVAILKDR